MPTLDWIGKSAVINHHREVPTRLLHCDSALSAGDPEAGNLLVQGDNLEALKALLPYYGGKVKCIYIDPPYNTGNEGWVYNDNVNSPEIRTWLQKVVGKEGEDFSRHDKWLCMMYPRLRLLHDFLAPDGSIWVSIDDAEFQSLRLLMDEIFGRDKFVAANVWQKRYSRENRESIGDAHEYVVTYARDLTKFKGSRNRLPMTEAQAKIYTRSEGHDDRRWRGIPMTAQGFRPNQMYEIEGPTGIKFLPPEGRCWSMVEAEFTRLRDANRIYFGKKGTSQPSVIRYLDEVEGFVPWTWWPHDEVGHTDEARKEVRQIFGSQTAFDTPKPTRLIERVLAIATSDGDLVLDSFAGSGTTAHAVIRNSAIFDRRFILIEMDQKIARDVTSRRIRYALDEAGATGFRYCTLGKPLFDEWGGVTEGVTFADLAAFLFFSDTGSPIPARADGATSLIGSFNGRAIHLLWSPDSVGVASPAAGNMLTPERLAGLPKPSPGFAGPVTIYAEGSTVSAERLAVAGASFRQIPYQVAGA